MQNQFWTDERVELLRRRWLEGMSASQIAKEIGEGATRNAVIGKVHRMGFAGRAQPQAPEAEIGRGEPAAPPMRDNSMEPEASAPVVVRGTQGDAELSTTRTAENAAAKVDSNGVVVPIAKRLPLEKLTERTCKWPIGDPGHPDFHFCGHASMDGLPYCRYHAGIAYQAADPRRRIGNRLAATG